MSTTKSAGLMRSRVLRIGVASLAAIGLLSACSNVAVDAPAPDTSGAAEAPLEAFVWDQDGGEVPDLPGRISWANTSNAEFFLAFSNGMEQAAGDRGVEFLTAIADDNPEKN
ncbi:MAG: hypothetical protein Q8M65_06115, partial [Rhodoglobus sp.]|nr:hypothetical protein [Rhodoglobus sp.]